MKLTHTRAVLAAKGKQDANDWFDVAVALIKDGVHEADDMTAEKLVDVADECDVSMKTGFADDILLVATTWTLELIAERRKHFYSFTAVADLLKTTPDGESPTLIPCGDDVAAWREATYEALVADGKPITKRVAKKALGRPLYDDPDKIAAKAAKAADAITVAASMDAEVLADRLASDEAFRSKVIDLAVEAALASKADTAPTVPPATAALSKSLAKLDLVATAQVAADKLRLLDSAIAADPSVAELLREVITMTVTPAYELLMLNLDGFPV